MTDTQLPTEILTELRELRSELREQRAKSDSKDTAFRAMHEELRSPELVVITIIRPWAANNACIPIRTADCDILQCQYFPSCHNIAGKHVMQREVG